MFVYKEKTIKYNHIQLLTTFNEPAIISLLYYFNIPYFTNTVEPGYNDIGLYDTSLQRQIFCGINYFLTVNRNIIPLGYKDTDYSVPFMKL